MKDCRKRQVERRQGETMHRCINKQADQYRQHVDASICDSCPVRVFIEQKKKKEAANPKLENGLPIVQLGNLPPCEFRHNGRTCGVTALPIDEEICNRCAADTKDAVANLLNKAVNYATAMRKWVAAGSPVRTDEEISAIFDEHCNKCAMFDKVRGVCNSCGCPASKDQPAIRNKLKMATEACPLGRFPAKVETNA